MKLNHVLPKADEHLRRGLSADTTIDVGLARKIFIEVPKVGDRVAEENDAVLAGRGRLERGVSFTKARELTKVVGKNRDSRSPVSVQTGIAGGRNVRLLS